MIGKQPLVERDMRALEQRADRDRERLAAFLRLALVDARTCAVGFGLQLGCRANRAAVRANRAIGSAQRLKVLAGCIFVVVDRIGHFAHRKPLFLRDMWGLMRSTSST